MNPATDLPPPTDPSHRDSLCALLAWYETLTPASLEMLGQFYAPDARFRDPFNDVRGTAAIHAIFVHMFNTVESARFTMATPMASGADAYVPWTFTGKVRGRAFDVLAAAVCTSMRMAEFPIIRISGTPRRCGDSCR